MTPQQIAASLKSLSPEMLGKLSHADLYQARELVPKNQQNALASQEHRAFAREATAENPLLALPIAVATLGYQPYKMITGRSRSDPSLSQLGYGLQGVGEGLWQAFQEGTDSIQNRIASTGKGMQATGLLESLRNYLPGTNTTSTPRR